jgi:hypothetical protein
MGAISKKDISAVEGSAIVAEAKTWKDTPYALKGPSSDKGTGGDCSGTTFKIYSTAKCPYTYQIAASFEDYALESGLFRELSDDEKNQEGDILSWPNHMAIYSSFASDPENATKERTNASGTKWTQRNNMWTASHPGGAAYGPAEMRFWRPDEPRVFRYQK